MKFNNEERHQLCFALREYIFSHSDLIEDCEGAASELMTTLELAAKLGVLDDLREQLNEWILAQDEDARYRKEERELLVARLAIAKAAHA